MFDKYPTERDLREIENWNFKRKSVSELIDYIEEIWNWPDWGIVKKWRKSRRKEKVLNLVLHTGGWSGNEEIISALEKTIFWSLFWEKSERGGHYYFEIPDKILTYKVLKNKK